MSRTSLHQTALALGCLTLVVAGCGGAEPTAQAPAQPQITSAPVAAPAPQQDTATQIGRLATELDEAQRQAKDAQALLAAERQQHDQNLQSMKSRDDLEDATWAKLDHYDARVTALRAEIAKATAARRTKVDRLLRDIEVKRNDLAKDARRVRTIPASGWDAFVRDVDAATSAIERELDHAAALR